MTAHTLRASGFDASEDGTGRGTPLVPVAFRTSGNCGAWATGDKTDALTTGTDPNSHVLAFEPRCARNGRGMPSDVVPALKAEAGSTGKGDAAPCVAFAQNTRDEVREMPVVGALAAQPGMKQTSYIRQLTAVRRLTPTECERLQGFPDGHTLIPYRNKPACDGPRYKALGNSMAVPVMRWIGERIQEIDQLKP
jgi:DNA (cytosine-5)-methyltransferase 1